MDSKLNVKISQTNIKIPKDLMSNPISYSILLCLGRTSKISCCFRHAEASVCNPISHLYIESSNIDTEFPFPKQKKKNKNKI